MKSVRERSNGHLQDLAIGVSLRKRALFSSLVNSFEYIISREREREREWIIRC